MREAVIVSCARTAIGQFGQSLKDIPVVQLGGIAIKEAIKRAGIRPSKNKDKEFAPDIFGGKTDTDLEAKYYDFDPGLKEVIIDEVIMGNVLQGGLGQNSARQASINGGVPKETAAYTLNKVCSSGLRAIIAGIHSVMVGDNDVVVAGGMENMSMAPFAVPSARWGARMFDTKMIDLMVLDGVWEIFYGYHMGVTAENIAARYGISRVEQDTFGLISHQRARKAIKEGLFKDEIVPVIIPQKKGDPIVFDTDERPMDTTLEKMAKLAPAFKKDGSVTAGNASGLNDCASAAVIMSREKANELGIKPLGKLVSWANGGVDPAYMGLGPVPAIRKALKKAGLTLDQMDVIELNEAFASQSIACIRELGVDTEKCNMFGGGVSLGHPIGCTGARLVTTAFYAMQRMNKKYALISMCIGGGMGLAAIFEREA
ncbi:MAG TPA: acetyl-CoA C-acetyltransferase [Syntrophorhabdus sp.]|nr:acetyl-CoA C-acetyltransferase [Syntrophorhabdus sp.]OQB77433.1 MAG: Acetyl-CoA acetyltransferase [Deltaproteobacteria bacterium ADurb.Bin135]HNS79345.1 acetyl-CoA C-acetyltransferase [Syntrophorhabdus sp.]HOD77549.1 acetyl-CoA C-acetyltransferase [Syntrophorhabdus sp.]HQM26390.1 acetyl-CoA C-acetyltransferase [Syntrophorhabdus sp.]